MGAGSRTIGHDKHGLRLTLQSVAHRIDYTIPEVDFILLGFHSDTWTIVMEYIQNLLDFFPHLQKPNAVSP